MKIKLKTQEQLKKDGWKRNSRSSRNYLVFGEKHPYDGLTVSINMFDAYLLGGTYTVVDYDMESFVPTISVQSNTRVADFPINAFEGNLNPRKFKKTDVKTTIADRTFRFNKVTGKLSVGCSNWDRAEMLKAIKWCAKVLGYKVVKDG
jgi:hypothetical protein